MSIVRINVIEVPEGMGDEIERRFAQRAGAVETVDGFESFELLRPTDGSNRYYVYTRWASEDAFEAWRTGEAFQRGHAGADAPAQHPGGDGGGGQDEGGQGQPRPVATGSELLSFDVVLEATKPTA